MLYLLTATSNPRRGTRSRPRCSTPSQPWRPPWGSVPSNCGGWNRLPRPSRWRRACLDRLTSLLKVQPVARGLGSVPLEWRRSPERLLELFNSPSWHRHLDRSANYRNILLSENLHGRYSRTRCFHTTNPNHKLDMLRKIVLKPGQYKATQQCVTDSSCIK